MGREVRLQYRETTDLTDERERLCRYVRQWLDGGWVADAELCVRDGRAEIASILITGEAGEDAAPAGGLRRAVLDAVHLRAIREYGHQLAKYASEHPNAMLPSAPETFLERPKRPSPPTKQPTVEDARIAARYVADIRAYGSRGVYQRMADQMGAGYSPRYVRKRIERSRGLLLTPAPRPGVAGGELTELAKSLLRSETKQKSGTSS